MGNKLRILFVDDSENDTGLIVRRLQLAGNIIVHTCINSADQMLIALQNNEWDLVISECNSLNINALDALLICKQKKPDLPFIVISKEISSEKGIQLLKAGVNDYFEKDELTRLEHAISRELFHSKIRIENRAASSDATIERNTRALIIQNKERLIRGESVSKSGNWELDLHTGITFASDGAKALYGLDDNQWKFEDIKNIALPEYRELLDNALNQLVSHNLPYNLEFRIRNQKSGQIIDIKSIAEFDIKNQKIFGVIQDITERKKTENALQKSEERFRVLFEGSPDAIFLADSTTGIITDANRSASRLIKETREKIIGMHHSQLHSSGFNAKMEQNFFNLINDVQHGKENYLAVSAVMDSEGKEIPVEILASLFILNGKTIIQGVFRDITARKNAELELINSEKKYRDMANSLPVSVFETDLTGIVTYANATTFEWFGYDESDIRLGFNILDFVFENDRLRVKEQLSQIIIQDKNTTSEYNTIRKDGSCFYVLGSTFSIKKDGIIVGLRCTLVDISDQKNTNRKLKLSERTLTNLISNLPGFVYRCRHDALWTMDYLSDGFCAITGYTVEELVDLKGPTYNDIIHPDYRNYLWNQWKILLELNAPLEEEYPIITKNGDIRWVWERGRGVYDENGQFLYLEGFIADITDRKRNEQIQKVLYDISTAVLTTNNLEELIEIIRSQLGNMLETNNFYVAFYNESSRMFYTPHAVDQKDNLASWQAEYSLTGYLVKQKKALLLSYEDIQNLVDHNEIRRVGTPSKLWLGVPLLEKDTVIGALVVQSYDNPRAYNVKDVEMLEFISHQISLFVQRKKAEGELRSALIKAEESDRLKSAFLATMNHELRTPLNHILGFSELILSGVMPEDNKNFASSIYSSGKNLLAIVEDVFDLALAEQANVKLRLQTFRLMDQFMENKSSFDQILQSSGKADQIQLLFKPDTRLLSMYLTVDRSKVNQILINLFKNAVKFTNAGTIEFGYHCDDPGMLTFFIKDTGIGIPKEKQSIIFDFFRQGDDSATRVYGGIGIGLAIALKITQILKGELSVVSSTEDGSVFYLTVPVELSEVND